MGHVKSQAISHGRISAMHIALYVLFTVVHVMLLLLNYCYYYHCYHCHYLVLLLLVLVYGLFLVFTNTLSRLNFHKVFTSIR